MRRATSGCLVILLAAASCRAGEDEPAPPEAPGRAPLVGRPADVPFSEASASFASVPEGDFLAPFEVAAAPTTTRARAGGELRYEVTIRARGKVHHPPERFDLRLVPAFDRDFHIEDITEGKKERVDATTWRWVFRLKPKHTEVRAVPGLPFAYYNPDLQPPERGFQVLWTEPAPIEVGEPEVAAVVVPVGGFVIRLAEGPAVLRDRRAWRPGPWSVAAAWAAPAALAAGWYVVWRRRYPDAARLARRRRSRAARGALRALHGVNGADARHRGEQVARVVTGYLHERFDLLAEEPTPQEGRELLLARRLPGELAGRAAALLAGCDAARFRPDAPADDLPGEARAFIVEVEDRCPSSS